MGIAKLEAEQNLLKAKQAMSNVALGRLVSPVLGASSKNASVNVIEKLMHEQDKKDVVGVKKAVTEAKVERKEAKEDSKTADKKTKDAGKNLTKGRPDKAIGDLMSGLGKTTGLKEAPENKNKSKN